MSDDYFARCSEARVLGDMRRDREAARMKEQGITDQMKLDAGKEIQKLCVGLHDLPPAEELSRREQIMACARVRGYLWDSDPGFDLIVLRRMNAAIEDLRKKLGIKP